MKKFPSFAFFTFICLFASGTTTVLADVKLPRLLSEHAVLKSSSATCIWGWAGKDEKVEVSLAGQTARTQADAEGNWKVLLDLRKVGAGPFTMSVKGLNTINVTDILLGEVWYASGQSNMDFGLGASADSKTELARPSNPQIRFFKLNAVSAPEPQDDVKGGWVVAGPTTLGNLSAVAYYFARSLQTSLASPVGIVQGTWGGSPVESWISPAALLTNPELAVACERDWTLTKNATPLQATFQRDLKAWLAAQHREDAPTPDASVYTTAPVVAKDWIPTNLTNPLSAPGLAANGVLWLRRVVNIPPILVGKPIVFRSGPITGLTQIYWNGQLIQDNKLENFTGNSVGLWLSLPDKAAHAGDNEIAIRIYAPIAPAGFGGDKLTVAGAPIDTGWLARSEVSFSDPSSLPPPPVAPPKVPDKRDVPGFLFNGMVHPLEHFQLSGIIWYQGESNAGRAWQYRSSFPLMIQSWRTALGQGDLPFYFCQIPQFISKSNQPQESTWAEVRDAQFSALKLPHTGQAVIIDTGEANDIHPLEKAPAGERLARLALAYDYGKKDVVPCGPIYLSQKIEGSSIRLSFKEVAGGLVAAPLPATYDLSRLRLETAPLVRNRPGSPLEGFQICGSDKKWVWADARIEGKTVVVSEPSVVQPVAVRYGWASNPTTNLTNSAGLPATPFRTDDFPYTTLNVKF